MAKKGFDENTPAVNYNPEYSGTVHSQVWLAMTKTALDPVKIRAWFQNTTFERVGGKAIIGFEKEFHREWVSQHYRDYLNIAFGYGDWVLKNTDEVYEAPAAANNPNLTREEELEIIRTGFMTIGKYLAEKEKELGREIPPLTQRQLLATVRRMREEDYVGSANQGIGQAPAVQEEKPPQTMPTLEEMQAAWVKKGIG